MTWRSSVSVRRLTRPRPQNPKAAEQQVANLQGRENDKFDKKGASTKF